MDRIRPWLYIGKYRETLRRYFLSTHGIQAMLQLAEASALKLIFWETAEAAFPENDRSAAQDHRAVFIVLGPEGGLTPEEVDRARQAGFQVVSLGPRILRAETATIAAGALVQFLFGDLGEGRAV